MSTIEDVDQIINNMTDEEFDHGFNEKQWDELINSNQLLERSISVSRSKLSGNQFDINSDKEIVIKLSAFERISSFSNSHKCIDIDQKIRLLISPLLNQRVRYEKECEETLRYISVPGNRNIMIDISNLRAVVPLNSSIWMRITRTTIAHGENKLVFYHPYPIWIKDKNAKIHHGSLFIQITENDMKNRVFQINNLTMIRLKQRALEKITTLPIYSPNQLDFTDFHPIIGQIPKQIRNRYVLRQSVLNFQLVFVDQTNIAYPTNCFCYTEPIREVEAGKE